MPWNQLGSIMATLRRGLMWGQAGSFCALGSRMVIRRARPGAGQGLIKAAGADRKRGIACCSARAGSRSCSCGDRGAHADRQ